VFFDRKINNSVVTNYINAI